MKKVIITLVSVTYLLCAPHTHTDSWDSYTQGELLNRLNLSSSQSAAQVQHNLPTLVTTLKNMYATYGDPSESTMGSKFITTVLRILKNKDIARTALPTYAQYIQSISETDRGGSRGTGNGRGAGSGNGTGTGTGNGTGNDDGSKGGNNTPSSPGSKVPETVTPEPDPVVPAPAPTPTPINPGQIPPPPPLPPLFPSGNTTKPAPVTKATLTFAAAKTAMKGLKIGSDLKSGLDDFWDQLKKINPSIFASFDEMTTAGALLDKNPSSASLTEELQNAGRTTTIKKIANKDQLLKKMFDEDRLLYFTFCTGSVATLYRALDAVIEKEKIAPNTPLFTQLQSLQNYLVSFITTKPADYQIKSVQTDFADCLDAIPDGTFRSAFRSTLQQTLYMAKAMKYVVDPATLNVFADFKANKKDAVLQLIYKANTELYGVELALQNYNKHIIATELTKNKITPDQAKALIEAEANSLTESNVKEPLDDATAAIKALVPEQKTTFEGINKELQDLAQKLGVAITPKAPASSGDKPRVNVIQPSTKLKNATSELLTELTRYLGDTTTNAPTQTSGNQDDPRLIVPMLETTLAFTANSTHKSPFYRTSSDVYGSQPNAVTIDANAMKIQVGILKDGYDNTTVDNNRTLTSMLGSLFSFLAPTQSDAQPIKNARGGYDLYVWGPEVADPTTDVYLYKRYVDKKITIRFANIQGDPAVNTTLYLIKSFTKQETADLLRTVSITMPTLGDIPKVLEYLYQNLIQKKPTMTV